MTSPSLVTPSQTVGPFFSLGLDPLVNADLAVTGISGRPIIIQGRIFDGDHRPVPDALIETWQADGDGLYPEPSGPPIGANGVQVAGAQATTAFQGFGRVATDDAGHFQLRTIMPGPTAGPDGTRQAPHLAVAIFMRGLLKQLVTRIYFRDDSTIGSDPILKLVDPSRRHTLVATLQADGIYSWDVRLQGLEETVFFDI